MPTLPECVPGLLGTILGLCGLVVLRPSIDARLPGVAADIGAPLLSLAFIAAAEQPCLVSRMDESLSTSGMGNTDQLLDALIERRPFQVYDTILGGNIVGDVCGNGNLGSRFKCRNYIGNNVDSRIHMVGM